MSRRNQIKRMQEALPEGVINSIPEEYREDKKFLNDILMLRREHQKDNRIDRRNFTKEFNKNHNTRKVKPLLLWTQKSKNTLNMTRDIKRTLKSDKNLIQELMKIIYSKFPDLIPLFSIIPDKRVAGKIHYSMKVICLIRLLALVCGIISMREINEKFNTEEAIANIKLLTGEDINSIPDWQTIQDVIVNMNIEELLNIRKYMIKKILESKMFDKLRYRGYVQVLVDATGVANRDYNLNGNCIAKKYSGGKVKYFKYVLEAKIVFGNIVLSLDTEWIENSEITNENDKQDCEIEAFKRMMPRIKKNYPRLPIMITGDALYAVEPVFDICEKYGWKYICNLKPSRLKNVARQFESGSNCVCLDNYKAVKKITHKTHVFTALSYTEYSKKGNPKTFRYVTNLSVCDDNIADIVKRGRARWKIENECFNTQKNGEYNISHLCSKFDNAIKIHYLFIQIAHILRQLLELGSIVVRDMVFDTKREISVFLCDSLFKKIISNLNDINKKIQLRFDM